MASRMASRRGSNFSAQEARQLTISFLHVSQDPIAGNGQRAGRFWDRVSTQYNAQKPGETPEVRSAKSLEAKWNQIKKETTKFCGAFSAIDALSESGTTWEIKIEKSLAMYKGKHPKLEDFPYLDCWLILREIPRWGELQQTMKKTTPLSDITNGNDTPLHHTLGPTASESNSPGDVSPEEDPGFRRPIGSKKAKESLKRQKVLDEALITQAKATSELTATILEKVALMKEQAMVALFSLKDDDGRICPEGKEFLQLKRRRDLARFKRELETEELATQSQQAARPEPRSHTPATASEAEGSDNSVPSPPRASRSNLFAPHAGSDPLPVDHNSGWGE